MAQPTPENWLTELTGYREDGRRFFALQEQFNPTGSIKDRMVPAVLDAAIASGELRRGMTIVEASSGNTGTALAYAASQRGFAALIVLADTVSPEKQEDIKRHGGRTELITSAGVHGREIDRARGYADRPDFYYFNQFENPRHSEAYRTALARPLITALARQKVRIDVFVAGVGTGASIFCVGGELRKHHNPALRIYAVIPDQFPTVIEGLHPGHRSPHGEFKIWSERPRPFEDGCLRVKDDDAMAQVLELERSCGIFGGPASGAVLHAARSLGPAGNVLVIISDDGNKYREKYRRWKEEHGPR